MLRLLPLLLGLALLAACAAAPPKQQPVQPAAAAAETPPPKPVERPFPDDSVYPLLVAEFALRRGAYATALANYMEQARLLDDPGVSRHTTHLAQFLQDDRQALEAVQLWLQEEPDNLEANNTAAVLLARAGRPLEALPHMALVARAGHQVNFPSLLQGYAALDAQQQAQLVQALEALSREMPNDPALLLTLALVYADAGRYADAQARLDALFAVEPEQQQALLLEARLQLQAGADKPFAHIEKVLESDPGNSRLRLEYARLLTTTNLAAARRQFEILSEQSPEDADLLLSLALINRETGDASAAGTYLGQVLETGKRQDEAHLYLGLIAEEAGRYDEALEQYRQVGAGREYLAANQHIGRILLARGEPDSARDWFREQREAHPESGEQLYGVEADLLKAAGDEAASLAVLDAGIRAYPDSTALRYARSMLHQEQADVSQMEEDLRAILRRDPDNATALNALGYTLADQTDRIDEAYALISRALELEPDEPAILDSMGWVLYRKGHLEEARSYLARAYAGFPDPEVAAHLGEVLWVSGQHEQALQVWQGALQGDPGHRVLLKTMRRFGVNPGELIPSPAGNEPGQ